MNPFKKIVLGILVLSFTQYACGQKKNSNTMSVTQNNKESMNNQLEVATLGAGCFWCVEAVFQQLEGVTKVVSGYSGGNKPNPTYREVSSGNSGHAEVCQITFDPTVITYDQLLEVYWQTHDPTTLNRQGADIGTQYRSVIFYHNEQQKRLAEEYKKKLNEAAAFKDPVVTEITAYKDFYEAEDYHQNYYNLNENQGYCRVVIRPKLDKLKKVFADKLKQPQH